MNHFIDLHYQKTKPEKLWLKVRLSNHGQSHLSYFFQGSTYPTCSSY